MQSKFFVVWYNFIPFNSFAFTATSKLHLLMRKDFLLLQVYLKLKPVTI